MFKRAIKMHPKFLAGKESRDNWVKILNKEDTTIDSFNIETNNVFSKGADIVLDNEVFKKGNKIGIQCRQTVIQAVPVNGIWNQNGEYVYAFTRDNMVVKLGGTRNSMKERFGSYLCGHHTLERGKSGKMSVTNAHLYNTIEQGLLNDEKWEIYVWVLPRETITKTILGEEVEIICQTYHAYESVAIKKFKEFSGHMPQLCDNCDPTY
jgi:hypothetical protein